MTKAVWKTEISVFLALLLLFCGFTTVFAEAVLPEGAVAGLPEKLTVMDSDGNSVSSETGEYFFRVENMTPGEVYTKQISVMNLREDKAYHIYFYAQPISSEGEIRLDEECTASFLLNGEPIYEGKVTGEGEPDMRETPLDLGLFEPGASATLQCSVVWSGTDAGGLIDYGHRVVDGSGTEVIREGSGDASIYGETTFRWIFYAVVDESYEPPRTGILAADNRLYAGVLAAVGLTTLLLFLLTVKKRREKEAEKGASA
ncbi:MAG: hypothetical protein Q4C48_05170 [Lachnospiraceae bacterium]|nr:hypothetical protein [Lachnospiraceae bacterium]